MENTLLLAALPAPPPAPRRRPGLRLLAAAIVLGLAAGCSTKAPPDGEAVRRQALGHIDMPATWRGEDGRAGQVSDNWIAGFNDARLTALASEAVAANPDLRVGAVKVEQAGEYVNLAKAKLWPAVNVFGTGGLKGAGGDLSSALQGIMLAASWELDLWGRLRYGRNAAEETAASVRSDFEFARQSIAATTAKGWFTASETLLQQQITAEMVASAGQLAALAEKRWRIGVGNEQDVALARANMGTFQDNAAQVRQAHQQALRSLEVLLGRYPAAELQASRALTSMPGPVPVGMPLDMLERRPDLVAAERRVAAAFHRVGEAKAALLPTISLNASVAAIESNLLDLKEDFSNPTYGTGARLLAPVFQGGALDAQVEIRTLEQKEAVAQYAATALRAINDVENALAAEKVLADRVLLLQQTLADNERALALTTQSYQQGAADMRAVQQQQLNTFATRMALLRVRSEQLAQRVNLHLALGGSFTTVATP